MSIEKVFFKNKKQQKLCGIIEDFGHNKEMVILVHGFSSNKDGKGIIRIKDELVKRKINYFRIDLDGCGESEGNFAEQNFSAMTKDVLAAISFVKAQGYTKISLFGSSAGGLAVMLASLQTPINKLGLKAPVSEFPFEQLRKIGKWIDKDALRTGYAFYVGKEAKLLRVNNSFVADAKINGIYDKAHRISCPVLIVHGDADIVVPLKQSQKLVTKLPQGKLMVIKGADHALEINGASSGAEKLFGDWFENKLASD